MKSKILKVKVSHLLNPHKNAYMVRISRNRDTNDVREYSVGVESPSIKRLEITLQRSRPIDTRSYFSVYPEVIFWYD